MKTIEDKMNFKIKTTPYHKLGSYISNPNYRYEESFYYRGVTVIYVGDNTEVIVDFIKINLYEFPLLHSDYPTIKGS